MSNYSSSKFNSQDNNNSWYKTFNLIPEKSVVLDVGCSSGNFGAELISQKKCVVDGIEINKSDLREASKRLRKVYELNIETDELKLDEKYDVVLMGDVIEHLAQPIPALKKVRQLLKMEGILVFSIPNITHMSVRLMLLKGEIQYGRTGLLDETHLHFYNREEVYRVLNSAGYEIKDFDFVKRDLPINVINNEIEAVGLKATDKFKEIAQSVNAAAYQFIGTAKPKQVIKQTLPEKSPVNLTDKYVNQIQIQHRRHEAQLEKKLADVTAAKEAAEHLVINIKQSRAWKVAVLIRRLVNIFKYPLNTLRGKRPDNGK